MDTEGSPLFAELMRRARERLGITQVAMAEALGVAQPQVSAWESGRRALDEATLRRYAEALGISLPELLVTGLQSIEATEAGPAKPFKSKLRRRS